MPRFTLGDTGADSVNGGIRSIFQALTQAPMLRDQMAQKAALMNAQTYQSNMSGNKYGSEAAANEYTLGQRKSVPDMIAADPNMTPYMQMALKTFGVTGDTNMERFAKAGSEFQTQGIRDKAVDNVGNIDMMNRYNTLTKDGATYEPFKAVGNTGRAIHGATGLGSIMEKTLAEMADSKTRSEIGENNAQAGLAGERIRAIRQGKIEEGTDEDGNPIAYTYGTGGKVGVVPGVIPRQKASSSEAALAKARARVVEQVYKDMMIDPADREAEIERRMVLIEGGAKSAAPERSAPTIPKDYKLIGTSGGKPVYQAPNGKKFIGE